MMRWEYRVEYVRDSSDDYRTKWLKNAGDAGWELVSVVHYPGEGNDHYFKRPLPPEPITLVRAVSCSTSYAPDIGISIPKETNE